MPRQKQILEASVEKSVIMVIKGLKALEESKEHQVHLAIQGQMVMLDLLENIFQASMATRDIQV